MATHSLPSTAEHHSLTHMVVAKCPATEMAVVFNPIHIEL